MGRPWRRCLELRGLAGLSAHGEQRPSGSAGAFSLAIDLTQNWPVAGVSAPSVGETWHFSAWFRDGAAGSNFTDAVSLTFE